MRTCLEFCEGCEKNATSHKECFIYTNRYYLVKVAKLNTLKRINKAKYIDISRENILNKILYRRNDFHFFISSLNNPIDPTLPSNSGSCDQIIDHMLEEDIVHINKMVDLSRIRTVNIIIDEQ